MKHAHQRTSPIADAFPISDLGAANLNLIIQACRAFPQLQAYEDIEGTHILIATEKPTQRQIKAFLSIGLPDLTHI
mgnify:CR=1 FL=1|jgi:hypothetical protein